MLWHALETGIPNAGAGMAGLVFPAVWGQTGVLAQSLMVPGSAMGISVSSTTTHSRQVPQSAVGMDGPGGAQGQDWCSESCTEHGDGAVPGGHGSPSAQDGCCLEVVAEGMVALGFGMCRHHGWYNVR